MPAVRIYTASGWQDMAIVGAQGPAGPAVNPYQIGQTWGIGGFLTAGIYSPVIFIPKRSNQSITVVGARAMTNTGTSIGVQLLRNGSSLGTVMTVSPTPASIALSQALADGDRLGIVTSAPVGNVADLSYTVFLEHSAT